MSDRETCGEEGRGGGGAKQSMRHEELSEKSLAVINQSKPHWRMLTLKKQINISRKMSHLDKA